MSDGDQLEGISPFYRAILIDQDGHTVSMGRIMAAGDDEAVAQAKALVDGHSIDLWDGIRFIEHFPAIHPPR